ncbi:MAG: acylphosphatase [Ilumatobacteraceae bacterium]
MNVQPTGTPSAIRTAARFEVTGIVQGVGFRPFVHRLAHQLHLDGRVGNDSTRVFVEAAGTEAALDEFYRRLLDDAPPLARVERVSRTALDAPVAAGFAIVESETVPGARTLVAPDTAVCDDCLAELFDPADRRHRHPFITCTNCGPRFTIIRELPYDRPATTMAGFALCPACAAEYADPTDRRYHAQPIACHDCGPSLVFRPGNGDAPTERGGAIELALDALRTGLTVAVKGWAGTTSPATQRVRTPSPDCVTASIARTSRSPSWCAIWPRLGGWRSSATPRPRS